MVELFYAIVGEKRVIAVEIGNQQSVATLKEQIKTKAQYEVPSDKLVLYLAKMGGNKKGKWMKDDDSDLVRLQNATIPEDIEKKHLKKGLLLQPTWCIEDYFDVSDEKFYRKKVIHVLVDTRGRDHVSVAVADENFLCLPMKLKFAARKVLMFGKVCILCQSCCNKLTSTHVCLTCPEQQLRGCSQSL
nr:crinkler 17 [Plasmopara viticola]